MPIEKLPIVHRFGILTEARRHELGKNIEAGYSPRKMDKRPNSRLPHNEQITEIVHQINSDFTKLQILPLEDEALKLLQKVKFQLSSKNGMDNFKECWDNLSLFISCTSRKLQEAALNILRRSLCTAPLSKLLLPTLVDTALSNIKELLKVELPYTWDTKYYALSEVVFLVCSRLYYHCLVQDLKEVETGKLEQLYLLNIGLNKTVTRQKDNPMLQNLLEVVSSMITASCYDIIQNSLSPSQINNDSDVSVDCMPVSETRSIIDSCIHSEGNIIKNGERPPIASILWNCLKLWKSISRQMEVDIRTIEKLHLIDFSTIDIKHNQWLDYILAFYTLCECSKLKIEYLRIFMAFRTKMSPKTKGNTVAFQTEQERSNEEPKNEYIWSFELIITYLKCLADISMYGISISIKKLALMGDDKFYGLMDYLSYVPDYEDSWKIRVCAYQLLGDTYSFYQSDPMKDGLKNVTWNSMVLFKASVKDKFVLNIIKDYQVKLNDSQQSINTIFSKIATNLCIMAFPPSLPSTNIISTTTNRPKTSKCFETKEKLKDGSTKTAETYHYKSKSRDQECWGEVQRIVEEHFEKELEEDEIENEKLRLEMLEDEDVT